MFGATCGVFSLCVMLLVVGTGAENGKCVCRGNFETPRPKPQATDQDALQKWIAFHEWFCKIPLINTCEFNCPCACPLGGFDHTLVAPDGISVIVCTDNKSGVAECLAPPSIGQCDADDVCPVDGEICCPNTGCQLPVPGSDPPVCAPRTADELPCATTGDCFVAGEICCEKKKVCEKPVSGSDPQVCGDPHMTGLRGQKIDWSGVDGGWYCLVRDDDINLQVNIRLTAPLADDFPDRQLITGLSILSEGHSLVVEVDDPYSVDTDGCLDGISPCLSNGGLLVVTDGQESKHLLHPTRGEYVGGGMHVSASNLPVECRLFGGSTVWAQMYEEMMQGHRKLSDGGSFEDWVMTFDHVAAPEWCVKYIKERGLADVQSAYALFRVSTPTAHVQLHIGIDHQGGDQLDWDGRALPDLDFWQMDAGVHGLSLDSDTLTGILGETARPMLDEHGHEIMEGSNAMRGTVEDYRVSGALGTEFALLRKNQAA